MELGAIGQTCLLNKIDFGIIRSISDNANSSAKVNFGKFTIKASVNACNILSEFLKQFKYIFKIYFCLKTNKPENTGFVLYQKLSFYMVEARGIEPLSEINISKTSTSVAFDLSSLEKSSKADFISN